MKILGEGPVQHFTNAVGVQGITGLVLNEQGRIIHAVVGQFEVGQTRQVNRLSFGQGTATFLAGDAGDIFVTELGSAATAGQLQQIGVFGDKQNYVIEFSRESAFANAVRLTPLFPARSIYGIPAGTVLDHADYLYTVTRLK